MSDFPYAADVGVHSYDAIINFQHKSQIPFTVSSTYRPGDPGYHGKGNAADSFSSESNMVRLAAWWTQYTPFLLELIHSGGGGFFVKNGKTVTATYYGAATVAQHYNHVHVAITNSGLQAIGSGIIPAAAVGAGKSFVPTTPAKGCLMPAAAALIGIVGGFSWVTVELTRAIL